MSTEEYLKSKGFTSDPNKYSGCYYIESGFFTTVFVENDGRYKIEFYDAEYDEESSMWIEDYSEVYSKVGESLQQFIERCI